MTPVIPCSINNISLFAGATFSIRKHCPSKRCNFPSKKAKNAFSSQRVALPFTRSVMLLPQYRRECVLNHRGRTHIVSATETNVAVEEANPTVSEEDSVGGSEVQSDAVDATGKTSTKSNSTSSSAQSRRARPGRKSEMPPVKDEELIQGATFNGKVRSIQPFGAFVDFGAFTDGLVHVSRLSDSFVKEVGDVVTVGQEVKVKLVEANIEAGRISLSMRENDGPASANKPRPGNRDPSKPNPKREQNKRSKFVKGQDLEGTVKNIVRAGAFITLPEGEEGFLPTAEEADDGLGSMMGASALEVGQEISVRVLRIARGQVTVTMKKDNDDDKNDEQVTQGVIHAATNPFQLAFRKNKDIASYLDEREKEEKLAKELDKQKASAAAEANIPVVEKEADESSKTLAAEGNSVAENQLETEVKVDETPDIAEEITSQAIVTENPIVEEAIETREGVAIAKDELQTEAPEVDNVVSSPEVAEGEDLGDRNESVVSSEAKSDGAENERVLSEESQAVEGTQEKELEITEDEVQTETPVAESASVVEEAEASSPENGSIANSNDVSSDTGKAAISPALVKQLREETGAGMMDCKNALSETEGDVLKAQEYLRKKGLASADKKSSRATAEGRIGSYIHDNRIGVLVEVNCETDFVSRGEIFKELVDDLAMQVAAYPQVKYVVTEDVPEEFVNKEKEIEMQKEDLASKPEQMRSRIVEGRIKKRLDELALLEQPYIKNDKLVVKDWVKQTISTIGENIKVKRFVRYTLGEGLEKKSQDFAAEVAAQTAAKSTPSPTEEQPAVVEVKEAVEKPAVVAVSPALVKQLREESGAGMMDCKKALSEAGGDLEKAQEYLRKKGLSSADKKSSRLAAEGRIGSYIHDARIGVLIEVNCETDFVGRGEQFKTLVDDLAMQVVACPQVQYVSIEDIPEEIVKKEKEIEMQREDLLSKPENIRERIVEGRISKRLSELALLEQAFVKDDSVLVKDLVKQTVAALGENIKVRRFERFTLGEASGDAETEAET